MGMNVHGGEDRRQQASIGESTLTVKWWAVLSVFLAIYGFFFLSLLNHENRITRNEEACKIILRIEQTVQAIRDDQIRRYEAELRDAKTRRERSGQ